MAEIQLLKIKAIYGDIKGLLKEVQSDKDAYISSFIVDGFNISIDELSQISNTDYSRYKITSEVVLNNPNLRNVLYLGNPVKAQIGRIISRLEEEYGFGQDKRTQQPLNIAIFNKNQNEVSVQIDYTIDDLIKDATNDESKVKLRELNEELEKPNKDWEIIKNILLWALNFSKDLFLQIIPIILQKKIN